MNRPASPPALLRRTFGLGINSESHRKPSRHAISSQDFVHKPVDRKCSGLPSWDSSATRRRLAGVRPRARHRINYTPGPSVTSSMGRPLGSDRSRRHRKRSRHRLRIGPQTKSASGKSSLDCLQEKGGAHDAASSFPITASAHHLFGVIMDSPSAARPLWKERPRLEWIRVRTPKTHVAKFTFPNAAIRR